ncbi:8-oxo-dGTP diphosphatase [Stackebrandtia albiflava]|uniref:8-oxo-dGTP diphosphatase n=1 Tax=Stackebrandtia albiflava TaxID=406432 RepID=A0A562UY81_9ACTN|nr:NUDIX domain-containing protein [Stackebrandtia albiflava]TWJ10600.1 8-oxo-dGTP diphosphatase [Stackebrandtia albiflava]
MQSRFRIAAYGVVWDSQGRILLARASERAVNPGWWFLPGGGVNHGEHPRDAVVREFAEETGLTVEVERARDVVSAIVGDEVHNNGVLFDVRITGGTLRPEVNGTTEEARWVFPAEVRDDPMTPFVAMVLGFGDLESLTVEKQPQTPRPTPPRRAKRGRRRRGQRFGVYGLTTDDAGRVLLARISDGYPGGGCWHLPGGGVDFGEQPKDALLREIAEETGQDAEIEELLDVTSFRHRRAIGPEGYPLDWHGVRAIYRTRVSRPSRARVVETAGGSTSESRWWQADQVPGLKMSAALSDALRIAGDITT